MGTLRSLLVSATARLTEAGVADPGREAAWLLADLLGISVGAMRLKQTEEAALDQMSAYDDLVARRVAREPLQYILGTEEFMGLTFAVSPAVLIPRADTETLVREVVRSLAGRATRLADIGTGSGAIAVSLAHLLPDAVVVATDISPEALAMARKNAAAARVSERIDFRQGDLLTPLGCEQFDAILSNPPYIGEGEMAGLMPEVRNWEPAIALTPGSDGLHFYRRLAAEGVSRVRPGGLLAVEVGAGQAQDVAALFGKAGLAVTVQRDTAGIERAVLGRLIEK